MSRRLDGALYVVTIFGLLAVGLVQWAGWGIRSLYFRIVDS